MAAENGSYPPGTYAWLVERVRTAIERRTGYPPCLLPGVGQLGAYCPVGCGGTVKITFLDNPPRYRVSSAAQAPTQPQPCPRCDARGGWLYTLDRQDAVCWHCYQLRLGGDGSLPEPGVQSGVNRCSHGCTADEIRRALA